MLLIGRTTSNSTFRLKMQEAANSSLRVAAVIQFPNLDQLKLIEQRLKAIHRYLWLTNSVGQ